MEQLKVPIRLVLAGACLLVSAAAAATVQCRTAGASSPPPVPCGFVLGAPHLPPQPHAEWLTWPLVPTSQFEHCTTVVQVTLTVGPTPGTSYPEPQFAPQEITASVTFRPGRNPPDLIAFSNALPSTDCRPAFITATIGDQATSFTYACASQLAPLSDPEIHNQSVVALVPASGPSHQFFVSQFGSVIVDNVPSPVVPNDDVVAAVAAPGSSGWWAAGGAGGVFAEQGAPFAGSMGDRPLAAPVVGMAATPDGQGYWLVAADGGVFAFGDARFEGSMGGRPLVAQVVGMSATADGGVFAFGDAGFRGSAAGHSLAAPVVAMAADGSGGYWLAAADGGVFAFGGAVFAGSMAGTPLGGQVSGITASGEGRGYWLVGADGGTFAFGDAPYLGNGAPGVFTGTPW